mgnify:CR=1 FL=1
MQRLVTHLIIALLLSACATIEKEEKKNVHEQHNTLLRICTALE